MSLYFTIFFVGAPSSLFIGDGTAELGVARVENGGLQNKLGMSKLSTRIGGSHRLGFSGVEGKF